MYQVREPDSSQTWKDPKVARPGVPTRWGVLALVLLALQVGGLAWQLKKEAADLAGRLWGRSWGAAVRREDPFYLWLEQVAKLLPPDSTYIFLDRYEFGKEIEARYHLFPRRHLLLSPQAPASLLYHTVRQHNVTYVLVRQGEQPLGPGLRALLDAGAAQPLPVPGPGRVFRVDPGRLKTGFYD